MGTVATLLAKHVTLRLCSVDRIGVAGYVRQLQHEDGLVKFLLHRAALLGRRNIPSPALLGHNHDRLVRDSTASWLSAICPWSASVGGNRKS